MAIFLFLFFYVNNGAVMAISSTKPVLSSDIFVLMEVTRGQVLYSKNESKLTNSILACKIMTAILALESKSLQELVTISKEAVSNGSPILSLEAGEKRSIEQLVAATLLTTAPEAPVSLAEYISGDISLFVDLMNKKAQMLNLTNTNFRNPEGSKDDNQYSCALDLANLTRYALGNTTFARLFSYKAKPWQTTNGTKVLASSNSLFWSYSGVAGGKTGYYTQDSQTSVTLVNKNEMKLLAIVGNNSSEKIEEDSIKLFEYGLANFRTDILVAENEVLRSITIAGKEINLISVNNIFYTHPKGDSYLKNIEIILAQDPLKPPLFINRMCGTARYTLMDDTVIEVGIYPDRNVEEQAGIKDFITQRFDQNKELFYLVILLIIAEVTVLLINTARKVVKKTTGRNS